MNNVLFRLTSLVCGLLFGLGMVISGMADPAKVVGFLNVAALFDAQTSWDPSLLFVMGGALLMFMPAYFLVIRPRRQPVNAPQFSLASSNQLDGRLIGGAALFGLGWGLAGVCPGPALASLALGNADVWGFFIAMLVGLGAGNVLICAKNARQSQTQTG